MQDAKSSQPEKKEPSAVVQPLVKKEKPKKAETKKVTVKAVKKSPSKAKKKKPLQCRGRQTLSLRFLSDRLGFFFIVRC